MTVIKILFLINVLQINFVSINLDDYTMIEKPFNIDINKICLNQNKQYIMYFDRMTCGYILQGNVVDLSSPMQNLYYFKPSSDLLYVYEKNNITIVTKNGKQFWLRNLDNENLKWFKKNEKIIAIYIENNDIKFVITNIKKVPISFSHTQEESNDSIYKEAIFKFSNGLIFSGTWLSLSNDQ